MFTSRAEHRLTLREDNADTRLTPKGRAIGLVPDNDYEAFMTRQNDLERAKQVLNDTTFAVAGIAVDPALGGNMDSGTRLAALVRRPDSDIHELARRTPVLADFSHSTLRRASIELKYAGYIVRESRAMEQSKGMDQVAIPKTFKYQGIPGLRREIVDKLAKASPETLGQAARISGVTPAAIQIIRVHLARGSASVAESKA